MVSDKQSVAWGLHEVVCAKLSALPRATSAPKRGSVPSCLSPCTSQSSAREGGSGRDAHLCSRLYLQSCPQELYHQEVAPVIGGPAQQV